MRTIYLVRHGQTLFNVHHKIQGTCDSPLTELGKAQATAVRKYFLSYTRLRDLHEKSHGEYEGQDEFMLPWRRGFSRINAAMEPDQHVEERMERAITKIIDSTHANDTILIVGHGTALRLFTQRVNPTFKEYDNCGIVKMKYLSYVAPAKDVVLNKAAKNEMLVVR